MKKLIFILLVGYIGQAQMIPYDKQKHLMAGAYVSGVTYGIVYLESKKNKAKRAFWWGFAAGTTAGILKEVKDEIDYGGFDVKDLGATMIGSLTACVALEIFRHKPNKQKKKLY